jgi:xanthine dehydrogenase accessory factor
MNSLDVDVLRSAIAWADRGHRVLLATVVRTWGSSPRPPGSLMVIRDDGQVAGSLSGGCIEDDLIERTCRGELASRLPQAVRYGQTAEESRRFGLPCGGSVQVVLEPLHAGSCLRELLAALEQRQRVERRLDMATGLVALAPAPEGAVVRFDGQQLRTMHGPSLRLLLIGGGQLSRCLAQMAVLLGYAVTVCEPREAYHEGWDAIDGVTLSRLMPDDVVLAMALDPHSAVVALTHDPKLDDLALMEALKTPAFYVGALGSRRSNEARRARLQQFGVTTQEAVRLRGPIGLNLGGRTPAEIALAVLAELTALQHGRTTAAMGLLADWSGSQAVCAAGTGPAI